MRIVQPYAKIISTSHPDPLAFVAWCGRVSHRSEDTEGYDVQRFVRAVVVDKGDWSITEHATVTVDAVVDRGVTHEIVRHRIAAYTQESTRFVNYVKKMPPSFVYPQPGVFCPACDKGIKLVRDRVWRHEETDGTSYQCLYTGTWLTAIDEAETAYQRLIAAGWRPQEARSVFPNALASRIVMTYNLRTWRHFFLMRTSREAHPQMRQVMIPLLREFQARVSVLYDDIVPEASQAENVRRGR